MFLGFEQTLQLYCRAWGRSCLCCWLLHC